MIALLRVGALAIPLTVWYSLRILWAARWGSPDAASLCEELPRRWARRLLEVAHVDVQLKGEHVIDHGALQVLVPNHTSWFDVLALAAFLPGRYRFIGKLELANIPFFGAAFQTCGNITIDRGDRSRALESMGEARRRLEEERPTIILFPEGTRSATGELRPFKKGAFVLAIQTGAAVVPAVIQGSRAVMPKGHWRIRPGTIRVWFGEPIPVVGLTMDDRDALTRIAWEAVSALQSSVPYN
jgi:1-acyl-sn-glycerol-3-phosphate acyltransferase